MIQNYDFGHNWDDVVKHLTYPKTAKWIKAAVVDLNHPYEKYGKNKSPARLMSRGDAYATLTMDITNTIRHGNYPNFISEEEKESRCRKDCQEDDCEKCTKKFFRIDDLILDRAGYNFKNHKDKLCFYIPFGSCHWWNKHFSLPLAKEMLPTHNWKLREGKHHTTVYSEETQEVFDIIFWGLENRLREHEFSQINQTPLIYGGTDTSLGGNEAYLMSR